jgi:hypothetical protein
MTKKIYKGIFGLHVNKAFGASEKEECCSFFVGMDLEAVYDLFEILGVVDFVCGRSVEN